MTNEKRAGDDFQTMHSRAIPAYPGPAAGPFGPAVAGRNQIPDDVVAGDAANWPKPQCAGAIRYLCDQTAGCFPGDTP